MSRFFLFNSILNKYFSKNSKEYFILHYQFAFQLHEPTCFHFNNVFHGRNVHTSSSVWRKDPGIKKRTGIFKDDQDALAELQDEEDFAAFESDFSNKESIRSEHKRLIRKKQDSMEKMMTIKKFFREAPAPSMLTWAERLQMRQLHQQDPDHWTIDVLADSFPATREVVSKVLVAKFVPDDVKKVKRYDDKVRKNWELLAEDRLEADPKLLEHLKKFQPRREEYLATIGTENVENMLKKEEEPKRVWNCGQMSGILESYERSLSTLDQKAQILLQAENGDSVSKMGEKTDREIIEERITFEREINAIDADSFKIGGDNETRIERKPITLEKLKEMLSKKEDKEDPLERIIISNKKPSRSEPNFSFIPRNEGVSGTVENAFSSLNRAYSKNSSSSFDSAKQRKHSFRAEAKSTVPINERLARLAGYSLDPKAIIDHENVTINKQSQISRNFDSDFESTLPHHSPYSDSQAVGGFKEIESRREVEEYENERRNQILDNCIIARDNRKPSLYDRQEDERTNFRKKRIVDTTGQSSNTHQSDNLNNCARVIKEVENISQNIHPREIETNSYSSGCNEPNLYSLSNAALNNSASDSGLNVCDEPEKQTEDAELKETDVELTIQPTKSATDELEAIKRDVKSVAESHKTPLNCSTEREREEFTKEESSIDGTFFWPNESVAPEMEQDNASKSALKTQTSNQELEIKETHSLTSNDGQNVIAVANEKSSEISENLERQQSISKTISNSALPDYREYPQRIKIPKEKRGKGLTYKLNDCYYDEHGDFLYRVPGMSSSN